MDTLRLGISFEIFYLRIIFQHLDAAKAALRLGNARKFLLKG